MPMFRTMKRPEDVWIPLVDEPIGTVVAQIQGEHPEIGELVNTPQRLLAFKTFAYIRVGLLLGELLVENDIDPASGSDTWIEQLLAIPPTRSVSCGKCGRSRNRSPGTPPMSRGWALTRPRANASANSPAANAGKM